MKEIFIHIDNYLSLFDEDVQISVRTNGIPRIGENVYLSDKEQEELNKQILALAPRIKESYEECIFGKNKDEVDVCDFHFVVGVSYTTCEEDKFPETHICLSNCNKCLLDRQH